MAGIQRFFTYIYAYENNKKKQNVGFAKVDIRGDYGQIEIHLKRSGFTNLQCPIYFFTREKNEMIGVKIGEMKLVNGSGDFGTRFDCKSIRDSEYSMREMKGIMIPLNAEVMFASQWDEKEIVRETFKEYKKEERKAESESLPEEKPVLEAELEVEEIERPEQKEEKQEEERQEGEKKEEERRVDENKSELQIQWEKLLEQYEKVQPFEEDDTISGIKIELKDLRELPKQFGYLGSNSFLLHGFFNYRHLLLGKAQREGKTRWFLGVPGVFENPERILAAVFGFPEFRQEKNTSAKTNQFGYWYRFMDE